MRQMRFWEMEPDDRLVKQGTAFAMSSSDELAAYLPAGGSVVLDFSPLTGPLQARWFNPREGTFGESFAVPDGPPREFKPPDEGDWALHLRKAERP